MEHLLVIMPARNAARTIGPAVRSTLRAMPPASKLLVWDDGSTDGTAASLAEIRDARMIFHRDDVSRGSGHARRQAMAAIDSQFIANMDADDICLPWRFRYQLRRLRHVEVTFSAAMKFRSYRSWRPTVPIALKPNEANLALTIANMLTHSSMTASRRAIEQAGGYRELRYGQDYDLWLRVAASGGRIEQTAMPCIGYRASDSQVSSRPDYLSALVESEQLRDSYLRHLTKLADSRVPIADPRTDPEPFADWLETRIAASPLAFRTYYRMTLASRGLCWRARDWQA